MILLKVSDNYYKFILKNETKSKNYETKGKMGRHRA